MLIKSQTGDYQLIMNDFIYEKKKQQLVFKCGGVLYALADVQLYRY
jgi:hypothetical protein